jgi:hypothetical protein
MDYQNDTAFCALFPTVLRVEGGFVLNPKNDPGGATHWGIAFNYNRTELQKIGIYNPTQMARLTREEALQIYYSKYWLACHANVLHDRKLQLIHFDSAVNHGVGAARLFLLKTKNRFGKDPQWLEGNGKNPDFFWRCYVFYLNERIKGYTTYKNRMTNLEGWMNRLEIVTDEALKLA